MADLIDRAPMLEFLDLQHYDKDMQVTQYSPDWIYSWLESQPTIEAKPVVHGEWETTECTEDWVGVETFHHIHKNANTHM